MPSSRGPPSSVGHNGDGNNRDNNDDSLFVDSNSQEGDYDEGDPEPWHHDGDNDGNDDEWAEDEENQERDMSVDNSSEVDPGVLDDPSDGEDEPRPRPRPRRRNPNPRPRTCRNCAVITQQWNDEVTRITEESQEKERGLRAEIRSLKEKIERLQAGNAIHWNPWDRRLAEFQQRIRNRDPNLVERDYDGYGPIYRDSCKQGIMSTDIKLIHPDLYLDNTAYSPAQIRNHFQAQWLHDRYSGAFDDLRGVHRQLRDLLFPRRYTRLRPLHLLENAPFEFKSLPIAIQCRIWKFLTPNGQMVHCLSRLDPWNPPFDCMADVVHFPSRFHVDDSLCSIAKADKPSRYLKYLLVSRRWYYAIAHLFYATNTFAFSSLGEFGRFCDGIGKARVGRLVHVELMWQGALTPRQVKGVSLRKRPLASFMYTSRLRTLVVHINESARSYMRRPYEMLDPEHYYEDFAGDDYTDDELEQNIFGMEVRRTDCQPNYRKTRSLRTVQGMDFIYQLRGMRWVRFYDTNAENARRMIRDSSFLQDVNNVVRRKKSDSMALKAEIENLRPLTTLQDFNPDDQLNELVMRFYDETPVEDVSVGGSVTSASSNSSGISRLSTFSSDSSPDDDSSGSSRSLSRTRRGSHDLDIDRVVEIVDSDIEMEDGDRLSDGPNDNGSQPTVIDLSDDTMSESGRSSRSGSRGSGGLLYESGPHTTVTPQPPVIVIEDDDSNDRKRRRRRRNGGFSTDSGGLFMPSGSCTAATDNILSSGSDNERPAELIDLTLEDVDGGAMEPRGSADPDSEESESSVSGQSRKRSGSDDGSD
ncbi:hypothetical protein F5B21DRAFT_528646 [Xylaria acuta]|nr:hypothetical protein F5B21DRAFT_528646 [Xylaria acuta]